MGGRGQNYTIRGRLPNYKQARIFKSKLYDYILDPENPKSKPFLEVGYDRGHLDLLVRDIRAKLGTNKALQYENDKFGNKIFQVNMSLGIAKKMTFTTGWIVPKGEKKPRLTTAYKNKSKYFKKE